VQEAEEQFHRYRIILLLIVSAVLLGVLVYLWVARPEVSCPEPMMEADRCAETCSGECVAAMATEDGEVVCMRCREQEEVPAEVVEVAEVCPQGTTADSARCAAECGNGLCMEHSVVEGTSCVACFACPEGAHKTKRKCLAGCGAKCAVVATLEKLQCWKCQE
jgi:hypothetical protein